MDTNDSDVTGTGWGTSNTTVNVETNPLPTFEIKFQSQPENEEPESFRLRRNMEIEGWLNNLAAYKAQQEIERDCRKRVTETLFPTPKKGTQRYEVGGGYKVKLVQNYTASIGDKDKTDSEGDKITVREQIEELEAKVIAEHGEAGAQCLKRLIDWEPKFSLSNYDKLEKSNNLEMSVKEMVRPYVTIKASTPQLEWEEPKES